ncbi:hypothetical protein BDZ89DRAFT_1155990 [Hymenopellis radicata]|nr:hypothetical protein BDZ89DRAFT_1155990 [Hymenopellis radicata]
MLPFLLPLFFVDLANAYSWHFEETPKQCTNVTVQISGSDGKGPYRILIVPYGSTPFSNNTEVRVIQDKEFPSDSATSITFQLPFPANSQYVAVVSDATGFGSGGTSVVGSVGDSLDSSCYDASKSVSPQFNFSIEPENQVVQCQSMRILWFTNITSPNFIGIIPGGESFTVPGSDNLTQVASQGTGFSWTPNIRGGTTLLLVGGDSRGIGTGGSTLNTVSNGINNDGSCLSNDSPSSTPGTPAGGSYATGTSGTGSGSSGGSSNTGAIVGGVVGGLVAILAVVLLLFFLRRRSRLQRQQGEKPVDLLLEDEGDERSPRNAELPQYYEPEPFIVPDPTVASDSGRGSIDGRPISQLLSDRSGTPDGTSSAAGRKGPMRTLRPVNIIQHDDAGPSEPPPVDEEPETVELPPAYTNIRK